MVEKDSLLREVDDAMRQDRLMGLWQQFKMPIVYACITLIVVTAGTSIWKNYQQTQAEKITLALEDAEALYAAKQYEKAASAFEAVTHQARGDLADMAKLWRARSLLGAGKEKAALRVLQNIVIAPEGHDLFWRDLACLHVTGLVRRAKEIPASCNGSSTSPLAPLLATFAAAGAWQEGDEKTARSTLNAIANDTNLSPEIRAHARAFETSIAHARNE